MNEQEMLFFEALTKDREENARILAKESMSGVKKTVVEKYSDQAHFIYELLQNADDVGATSAQFILKKDRLVFIHNGKNSFSISNPLAEKEDKECRRLGDINSLTSIGNSNKTAQVNKIGKFGVGFKSVFQYTNAPEIYANNVCFKIERFIVPIVLTNDYPNRSAKETVFVFPFNSEDRNENEAFTDISDKLRNLNYPILFLSHLKDISFEIENDVIGLYGRSIEQEHIFDSITARLFCLAKNDGDDIVEEKVWIFSQKDECGLELSVGFFIGDKGKIVPKKLPAFCFFPTKETTNLNFAVHAPFLLTDSREGIRAGVGHNKAAMFVLANIAAEALQCLTILGQKNNVRYIDDNLLDIIPYDVNKFSDIESKDKISFKPFYSKIKNVMTELLPALTGYVEKENAYWMEYSQWDSGGIRFPLTDIFTDKHLAILTKNDNANWVFLSKSRQEVRRTDPILANYIDDITAEFFGDDKIITRIDADFIEQQADNIEWFHKFYRYIGESATRMKQIKNKPIFLNKENKAVAAFDNLGKPILFLPTETEGYITILPELLNNPETLAFIGKFGIKSPQLKDEIYTFILPQYQINKVENNNLNFKKIFEYYLNASASEIDELITALNPLQFLRYNSCENETIYRGAAGTLYFPEDVLLKYFMPKPNTKFIRFSDYTEMLGLDKSDKLKIFFAKLGVASLPRINRQTLDGQKMQEFGAYPYSYTCIYSCFTRQLDGFDEIFNNIISSGNKEQSIMLWNILSKIVAERCSYSKNLYAILCGECHYKYYSESIKIFDSAIIKQLKTGTWLFDSTTNIQSPENLFVHLLSSEYNCQSSEGQALLEFLDINEYIESVVEDENENLTDEQRRVLTLGQSLLAAGYTDEDILEMAERKKNPVFPENKSKNPERRRENIGKEVKTAPRKEYTRKTQSMRTSAPEIDPTNYLKTSYTNDDGIMVCQICQREMPFKKKDGDYYFECVELFDKEIMPIEHEVPYLALCPICSAKYNVYAIHGDEDILTEIANEIRDYDFSNISRSIDISLDKQESIRFGDQHLRDISTILNELDTEENNDEDDE